MDYMREASTSRPLSDPSVARIKPGGRTGQWSAPFRRLGGWLSAIVVLYGSAAQAQPVTERVSPQPVLPRIELSAGMHVIRAEVADTGERRMKGLMMRERLGPNEGMLFVFEYKAGHCFWMKNTLLPLSIAFLEDDGTVVNIENMTPQSEQSHCPLRPIRYALEMEQGWFAKRGVRAGAKLTQPALFSPQAARP